MKTQGVHNEQISSGMPHGKYRHFLDVNPVSLPDRTWPDKRIEKAPRWLSTDLRDGNQALIEPMDPARKRQMFDLLISMGYKEIEIGFPAASQADWDFVRSLAEQDAVPEDVTVSVLTQARTDLIHRTVDALEGFPRATVHLYNATSPLFRRVVFGHDRPATKNLAVTGAQETVAYLEKRLGDETIVGFQYSPEIFVDTELDFALEVCEAVIGVWQPEEDREIILNLPTTVERCTPNVYADQIEWMSRNISHRDNVVISAHNHNDRGSAVATSELAMLAGADRIEGCLFGQGERTGNVDLVTLGLNLLTQGIDPQIDFSRLDHVRATVEHCTRMEVPARAPYAGDLVYTSFSGSHQDAIKKGFEDRERRLRAGEADIWEIPYLPLDPADIGRSYEAVVRVNSQSGKGGVAYLLSSTRHLNLPRRMQIELSRIVQRHTDIGGGEITADELWNIFADEYLPAEAGENLEPWGSYALTSLSVSSEEDEHSSLTATVTENGVEHVISAEGNGPIDAFAAALSQLGHDIHVLDYAEHALSEGADASAAAYVEAEIDGQVLWGAGIDPSVLRASVKAIVSALNRSCR
ncbi:MAG: 2-isopropylmalate synthase [Flaviflexus sp.]|nr:2-isopropylmalate synthase [Flaviflexus sp.]